jgi:Polyketide cyclase / dehydrase and lipid transport
VTVRIRVHTMIDAPPAAVWADVERLETHVEWMRDARSIRFLGRQRRGAGTRFACRTRIGPFTTIDLIRVTEWKPKKSIGIEHRGVVSGRGRFTLQRKWRGRTRFTWDERLTFPGWMGGWLGEHAAAPFLRRIWKANLRRLAARF